VTTPRFSCIYCDDVRSEVGGKLSLMGIYNGSILFHEFPATVTVLTVVMTLAYPIDEPIETLKFELTDDDGIEFSIESTKEELEDQRKHLLENVDEDAEFIKTTTIIRMPNVVFNKKTVIRSMVTVNGDPIRGDGLIVKLAT
jgi:hypothetical protein